MTTSITREPLLSIEGLSVVFGADRVVDGHTAQMETVLSAMRRGRLSAPIQRVRRSR